MGRRTAAETEALRRKIVDCAVIRFADRGMDATSMADIARDVGLSKQALMHHFRNRDALEDAIIERFREHLDAMLPHYVAAFTAQDTELDAILTGLMDAMDEDLHLTRFALRQLVFAPRFEPPPAGRAMSQLFVDYLRRGQQDGKLRPDFDPEATMFNLGMMMMVSMAASEHRGSTDPSVPMKEVRLRRSRDLVRIARRALLPDDGSSLEGGC